MARADLRLADARAAHAALRRVMAVAQPNERDRDSVMLNFMLAAETVWKAAQAVLAERIGEQRPFHAGPKATVRECRAAGLLGDEDAEQAMKAIEDRNLVVHTYRLDLALEIHGRIPAHAAVMDRWLSALEAAAAPDAAPPRPEET